MSFRLFSPFLVLFFFLSSCAIDEISRLPLLASPLGLKVKLVPVVVGPPAIPAGFAMYFTANNDETYFDGFSIFISTQKSDFEQIKGTVENDIYFPIPPTEVPSSDARLLPSIGPTPDTNLSIFVGFEMSDPAQFVYPSDASPNTGQDPVFISTSFTSLPPLPDGTGGGPFATGTYYFAVYAYSSLDVSYSLASNIEEVAYP